MFLIYDLFGFIFLILSPLLFVFRILMGKEDVNRLVYIQKETIN